jgi:hypothetical protein
MRIRIVGTLCVGIFIGLGARATPTEATILHPWCSDGTGNEAGVPICGYDSYEQCIANRRACIANPARDPLPQATPQHRTFRRSLQPR